MYQSRHSCQNMDNKVCKIKSVPCLSHPEIKWTELYKSEMQSLFYVFLQQENQKMCIIFVMPHLKPSIQNK